MILFPQVARLARRTGLLLALAESLLAAGARAQSASASSPYDLARTRPGEPTWAPLMRLRASAPRFDHDSATQRQAWLQLLAQAEATFGNYDRALAAWDRLGTASTGDLDAARRRFTAARQVPVLDTLRAMADTARVIMINERHHAASDRLLTLQLLRSLRAKGFRYFAAEAFPADSALRAPAFPRDDDSYTSEPLFAELVREARRLGYTLVAYEAAGTQWEQPDSLTPQQRRDWAQAHNLAAATVERDPRAKVLVHAGFDHVRERATPAWHPMAAYFRARTGIDPVTVDQTSGSERSTPAFAHPVHRVFGSSLPSTGTVFVDSGGAVIGASAMLVDLVAIRAAAAPVAGRPAHLAMLGTRRAVTVRTPPCRTRHCVLVAHRAGDPPEAAVLDRVEVERTTTATLMLPNGVARLTLYDVSGARLQQWTRRTGPSR